MDDDIVLLAAHEIGNICDAVRPLLRNYLVLGYGGPNSTVVILKVDRCANATDGDVAIVEGRVRDSSGAKEDGGGDKEENGAKVCPEKGWRGCYPEGEE